MCVQVLSLVPNIIIYNSAISACEKAGQWQLALAVLRQTQRLRLRQAGLPGRRVGFGPGIVLVLAVTVGGIGVLFGWFAKKKGGRFLVYLVVQSSARAIYFTKEDTYGWRLLKASFRFFPPPERRDYLGM